MAQIEDHVRVSISVSAKSPARATFAVPLFVGFHTAFPELVRTYSSLAALEDDGFDSEDVIHKAVSSLLSQNPTVPSFKVGRLTGTQTARVVKLLATAQNSTLYAVKINGRTYEFTSDSSATAAEIAAGLQAVIDADTTIPVTASVDTNNLVLTADVAGEDFYIDVTDETLWASIQDTSTEREELDDDLSDILAVDGDWYALVLTRPNHLEAAAAAAWIETRKRILVVDAVNFGSIVAGQNNLASNVTSLMGVLGAAERERTLSLFTKHEADFPSAGLLGVVLPKDPGSWTAKFKSITGAQATFLTDTERLAVEANNGNHYQTVAGINMLADGVMASGQFLDVRVFVDWLEARIKEEIFASMVFLDKVPFTEGGVAIMENAVRKVLDLGVRQGGLVEGSIYVRGPAVSSVSAVDKAARYYDGLQFGGTLAGAIHEVDLAGTISP